MQRFAVNVANPTSIPDVPSKRRDVSEHDELDERLDEREHAERQRHVPTSSAEPMRFESDRHKKRKRDLDDKGTSVRRKYDKEGNAEFAELLLENGLMMTRTTDTFDPQTCSDDTRPPTRQNNLLLLLLVEASHPIAPRQLYTILKIYRAGWEGGLSKYVLNRSLSQNGYNRNAYTQSRPFPLPP